MIHINYHDYTTLFDEFKLSFVDFSQNLKLLNVLCILLFLPIIPLIFSMDIAYGLIEFYSFMTAAIVLLLYLLYRFFTYYDYQKSIRCTYPISTFMFWTMLTSTMAVGSHAADRDAHTVVSLFRYVGFIGTVVLAALYCHFMWRLYKNGRHEKSQAS